jgi:hypothetical protein
MSDRKPLTVRSVKNMLTRAGVDHSKLTFTATNAGASVIIGELGAQRRQILHALLDRGLGVAPYPDKQVWSR